MEENKPQQPESINLDEIKPVQNSGKRNYLKISLPLAVMVMLAGGVYLTVNNALQEQQDTRSRASTTTVSKSYAILGDYWKYLDNNTRPSGWNTLTYSDSTWKTGQAKLGYGNGGEKTIVSKGSSSCPYITTYFRKTFTVSEGATVSNAKMRINREDGIVVYINGTEVHRSNMPTGTIGHSTLASNNLSGSDESVYYDATIISSAFKAGTNVIAAEVHQATCDSDDLNFDASLTATETITFSPTALPSPTSLPTATSVPPTATPAPSATTAPLPTPTNTPVPTNGSIIFTINKSSYNRGESMTVYWQNIPNATPRDWIGLYTPTTANGSEIGWIYLNCTQTATVAVPSGECTFPIPDTAPAGTLELRLHQNDGNTVLAKSPQFTLVGPTPTMGSTITPTAALPTATLAPANTPIPGSTSVAVNLLLHGIGKGGDAVNAGSLGNMTPLRPQRTVTVDVYDVQNQLVLSKQGTVTFNATAGNFTGYVDLGTQFTTGLYTVKVKTEQHLRGLVGGIQTLTQGQTTTLSGITLTAGDVNNDNAINIVDYNLIVGCYSDLLPPVSCTTQNKPKADITDDGKVNQFDYNLFIRELTNLGGQ